MEEIPDYPLDQGLTLLPPQEWHVEPCGDDAVAIGAWIDAEERLIWRVFRFGIQSISMFGFGMAGPKLFRAGDNRLLITPVGTIGNEFYILPDGPKITRVPDDA